MVIKLYISTITSILEIKKEQQLIQMFLKGKNIEFVTIDIAASEEEKEKMRALSGKPDALPPQLFNDDTYLGDFEKFEEAAEQEDIDNFLQMT